MNYFEKEFVNKGKLDYPRFFLGSVTVIISFIFFTCLLASNFKILYFSLPCLIVILIYGIYLFVNTYKKVKQVHLVKSFIYLIFSILFLIINFYFLLDLIDKKSTNSILVLMAITFFISCFAFWLFNIHKVKNGTYGRFDSIKIAVPNVFLFAIGMILFKFINISVSEKYIILIISFCSYYLSIYFLNENVKEVLKFVLLFKSENE